jgi:hypothetical protein
MAAQTNLKYGMTQDTLQVQERFSRLNPAYTPWQPNGSGNGKVLDMILKSLYFEDGDTAILLPGVPFAWLRENGVTALRNLRTPHGAISLDAVTDGDVCRLTLRADSASAMPKMVRVPEHFVATSELRLAAHTGRLCFQIPDGAAECEFTLHEHG